MKKETISLAAIMTLLSSPGVSAANVQQDLSVQRQETVQYNQAALNLLTQDLVNLNLTDEQIRDILKIIESGNIENGQSTEQDNQNGRIIEAGWTFQK